MEFRKYQKSNSFKSPSLTDQNIDKEVSEFERQSDDLDTFDMSDEDLVSSLSFISRLYDYINVDKEQKNTPVALFWIARIEQKLQRNMFFSMSDLYLRACIKEYPSHPYGKKCFQKYKQEQIDSFTGTRGTELPASVKAELDRFEKLVK